MGKDESKKNKFSRRKLIQSIGLTTAAVATGGMIRTVNHQSTATPITDNADRISYQYKDGLPERTVGEKLRSNISVLDFGAIGDGITDDTLAIQAALAASILEKKTLIFPDGLQFIVSDQLNIDGSMRMVFGLDAELISNYTPAMASEALIKISADHVDIVNISIDGRDHDHRGISSFEHAHFQIQRGCVRNLGMIGIYLENCKHFLVHDVEFVRCTLTGDSQMGSIRLTRGLDANIQRCIVKQSYGKGIACSHIDGVIFKDCTVYETLMDAGDGIYIGSQTNHAVVEGCRVLNAQGNAIKLSGGAKYIAVRNNSFIKSRGVGSGIFLQGALHADCYNNFVTVRTGYLGNAVRLEDHPDPRGSDCAHNRIYNNLFVSEGKGTQVVFARTRSEDSPYSCYNISITDNYIKGGTEGLRIYDSDFCVISKNAILEMESLGITITSGTSTKGHVISENKIIGSKSTGIQVSQTEHSKIMYNFITALETEPTLFGISLSTSCHHVNIHGNNVIGFANRQIIATDPTATGAIISENDLDCQSNGSGGIEFRGIEARIVNNIIGNTNHKLIVTNHNDDLVISGNGSDAVG